MLEDKERERVELQEELEQLQAEVEQLKLEAENEEVNKLQDQELVRWKLIICNYKYISYYSMIVREGCLLIFGIKVQVWCEIK